MMKRIYSILTLITLLVCGGMTSCSDDIEYRTEENIPTGIYLTIPDVSGALDNYETRADDMNGGDPAESASVEGTLNDLYLYIFHNDAGANKGKLLTAGPVNLLNETPVTVSQHGSGAAKTYSITDKFEGVAEGSTFHIYVVANLGAFTESGWDLSTITETDLQGKLLNFKSGTNDYLLKHENIKETGLPMACMNSEIGYSEDGSSVTQLTYKKNVTSTVHADMKFLCSKVRYTVLFDNSTGTSSGFSTAVFGTNAISSLAGNVTSLNNGSQSLSSDELTSTSFFNLNSIYCGGVTYPGNPDSYPSENYGGTDQRFTNLPTGTTGGNKRAWQGTVYLPANPDLTKPTKLEFTATLDEGSQTLTYTLPLVPPTGSETEATALQAGYYYDIVAKVKGLEELQLSSVNVTPWTREQLVYTLAQNLYLSLSTTSIDKMEAGQEYAIRYETSGDRIKAADVTVPKYITAGGRAVDLYVVETKPGDSNHIYISINPDLESSWFQNITEGKQGDGSAYDFNWIEIKACGGIINKKIEIGELDLHRFLRLSTNRMYINVHELTSSGYYDNPETTEFEVETNINEFWVQIGKWPGDTNEKENRLWLQIAPVDENGATLRDEDGRVIWNESPEYLIPMVTSGATITSADKIDNGNGVRVMRLRYTGLNSGYPIWTETQTYNVSFRVDNTGYTGNNYVNPASFSVSILPDNDKYIIHFKSKDNSIGNPPHIYVYQCLEVPSYVTTTYNGESIAGLPVSGRSSTSAVDDVAALEYSFTGKIAFRGWDWDKNKTTLAGGTSEIHQRLANYIQFIGDWNEQTNSQERYNTNMDFFDVYRNDPSRCVCAECRDDSKYNKGFPGICMEAEGNGWFKLELPGIATPGRALIIWNDKHDRIASDHKQHPSGSSSGIRLFDYPSKEAWYYYEEGNAKANKWFASKAAADAAAGGEIITDYSFKESNGWIYFTNPDSWTNVYIHYWGGTTESSWPGVGMKKMTIDGKQVWAYKIPTDTENIIFNAGSDVVKTGDLPIDDTTNYYNKEKRAGEALSDAVYGTNWTTWPTDKPYRLYWKGDNKRLWVWTKTGSTTVELGNAFNGDSNKDYDNTPMGVKDGNYCYKQYKVSKPAGAIHWKFTTGDTTEKNMPYTGNEAKLEEHSSYYKLVIEE